MSSAPGAAPGRSTATRAGGMVAQELLPGEQVLWSGQPDRTGVQLSDSGAVLYVILAVAAALVFGFPSLRGLPVAWQAGVLLVVAAIIIQAVAMLIQMALLPARRRGTVYQVTDYRIVVTRGQRARYTWSAYLDQVAEPVVRPRRDGSADVVLEAASARLRTGLAGSGPFSSLGRTEFPVLESLADAAAVQQVITAARQRVLEVLAAARPPAPPDVLGPVPPAARPLVPSSAPVVAGLALQSGEQVLWTGRPLQVPWWFGTEDIGLSAFGVVWSAVMAIVCWLCVTTGSAAVLILPFGFIGGLYPTAGRVLHRRLRIRRSQYVITSRRVAVQWQLGRRPVTVQEPLGRLLPPQVRWQSVVTARAEPGPQPLSGGWRNIPWPASTISPPALIGIADLEAAREAMATAQLAARQSG